MNEVGPQEHSKLNAFCFHPSSPSQSTLLPSHQPLPDCLKFPNVLWTFASSNETTSLRNGFSLRCSLEKNVDHKKTKLT